MSEALTSRQQETCSSSATPRSTKGARLPAPKSGTAFWLSFAQRGRNPPVRWPPKASSPWKKAAPFRHPPAESLGLPLIGRVAAGSPILAEAHVSKRLQVDPAMFPPRADYLLEVRGMSMRDVASLDGDLLAVHRTSEVRAGQIVVARVNDEVTVKTLARKGHMVELLPANPDFEPIVGGHPSRSPRDRRPAVG